MLNDLLVQAGFFQARDGPAIMPPLEMRPDAGIRWKMHMNVWELLHDYYSAKEMFSHLQGSELGIMPLHQPTDSDSIKDLILFDQFVKKDEVLRTDLSTHEAYNRAYEQSGLNPCGMIHFHPDGDTRPTPTDKVDFRKLSIRNLYYQQHYGWVDATNEAAIARHEPAIMKALEEKDAVIISEGGSRLFFKVHYGFSFFMILAEGAEPWIGVGECRKYCFDGGPASYRLLEKKDGIQFMIEEYGTPPPYRDLMAEIESFVKPMPDYMARTRRDFMANIQCDASVHNKSLIELLERRMPTTVQELMEVLRTVKPGTKNGSCLHDAYLLLRDVYRPGSDYAQEKQRLAELLGDAN